MDDDDDDDDRIIIAIDSTGIKVTNRGQWIQDKWNIGKRERIPKDALLHDSKNS